MNSKRFEAITSFLARFKIDKNKQTQNMVGGCMYLCIQPIQIWIGYGFQEVTST